jgi:hypothetical protein
MNLISRKNWFTRALCRHGEVSIARWHASCVSPSMRKTKVLFVDIHDVVNMIQCRRCGEFVDVVQRERIYAPKADE